MPPFINAQYDPPFGSNSIFFNSQVQLSTYTTDGLPTADEVATTQQEQQFGPNDEGDPNPVASDDVWVLFVGFDFEASLERFLAGGLVSPYSQTINQMLEAAAGQKPRYIVCAYVRRPSLPDDTLLAFRFSKGMCTYLQELAAGSGDKTFTIQEKAGRWTETIAQLGLQHDGFNFSQYQVADALQAAIPYNKDTVVNRLPSNIDRIAGSKQYETNYQLLSGLVKDPGDPQTRDALMNLCKVAVLLNTDVLQAYNQQPGVRYNTSKAKELTASDLYYMARRLLKLSKEVKNFQQGNFKTANEVLSFVNANLVDPSALGEETKFVINYPFEKLNYEQRKQMLLLLLDGQELDFSGFWAGTHWDGHREVSAGDVVFNLLRREEKPGETEAQNQAQAAEMLRLIRELEREHRIFDMLNAATDNDFRYNITVVLYNILMLGSSGAEDSERSAQLIKEGNFIYFDFSLLKNRSENLDAQTKKIQLANGGNYIIPVNSSMGEAPTSADLQQLGDQLEENEAYKRQYTSTKTLFDPLEPIILFAEDDIYAKNLGLDLKKGDRITLPACMVYLLFQEDTDRAVDFAVALTTTVVFLPFGVGSIAAAIEAANALGILVGVADIAADAAYLTYSLPPVQNSELKEDLEWINTVVAMYGLARLSYSLKDVKTQKLLKDIYQAGKLVAERSKQVLAELGKLSKQFERLRFRFTKYVIDYRWKILVRHIELDISVARKLTQIRTNAKTLEQSANIAIMRVKVLLKSGETKELNYIAHSGSGKKITGMGEMTVVTAPQIPYPGNFEDLSAGRRRWLDSENKMLIQMDKDLLPLEVKSMEIEIESTFSPCTMCRREILLRTEKYKAIVSVKSPKFINEESELVEVLTNRDFLIYLDQKK